MNAEHEPDLAFVENLEWQVKTALRRRERFAEPASRRLRSAAQLAGLVLLSLTVGAAGAVAAGKLQDDGRTELLLAQKGIQVQLAERRVGAATDALGRAQERYEQGLVSQSEIQATAQRLLAERFLLDQLELERAEMRLSGERANLAFSAPVIAGRDFITERLALELSFERSRLQILDEELEVAVRRFATGLVGPGAEDELRARVLEARGRIEALEEEILLRGLFVAGELAPAEVELRRLRLEVHVRQRLLRIRYDLVKDAVQRTRMLFEQGVVSDSGLGELQLELDALEADLILLELEARILDQELGIEVPEVEEAPALREEKRRKLKEMGYTRDER